MIGYMADMEILDFEKAHLEDKYPDFRNLMKNIETACCCLKSAIGKFGKRHRKIPRACRSFSRKIGKNTNGINLIIKDF